MVTHPCGDYALLCLTRVSRVSALAVCHCPPSACIPDNRTLSASAPGVPFNSLSCPFFSKHVDFANAERDHCLQAGFVWEDRTPSKRSDQWMPLCGVRLDCSATAACVRGKWSASKLAQWLLPLRVVSDEHHGWHCLKVAECACAHIHWLYI